MAKLQNFRNLQLGVVTEEQLKEIFENFLASNGVRVQLQICAFIGEQNKLAVKITNPEVLNDETIELLEKWLFDEEGNEEDMDECEPSSDQVSFGDELFEACFGSDAKYFLEPVYAGNELINEITVAMSDHRYMLYNLSN